MGIGKHKKYGIHLYVNIDNLNSMIKKDESKNDDLARTFHQVNTFIESIEKFVENFSGTCFVEKFTTSRLHLYFVIDRDAKDSCNNAIIRMFQTICFARCLANKFKNIKKYEHLPDLKIGVGADIGEFVEFEYQDNGVEEMTTIGPPANRAAKLQSVVSLDDQKDVNISKALHDLIPNKFKSKFFGSKREVTERVAASYADLGSYSAKNWELEMVVSDYSSWADRKNKGLETAVEIANKTNIGDISTVEARKKIDFEQLSLRNPRYIDGVMLYADIRGFTNKVDKWDLEKTESLTRQVLQMMNHCVDAENGVHVQFQGDRESGFFYDHTEMGKDFVLASILAAMRMIDGLEFINQSRETDKLRIGIGMHLGDIYLSRLGRKGNKFNIAMGQTVREADKAEDDIAGVGMERIGYSEIAITAKVYKWLLGIAQSNSEAKKVAETFLPYSSKNEYYISRTKFSDLFSSVPAEPVNTALLEAVERIPHRLKSPWILPKGIRVKIQGKISYDGVNFRGFSSDEQIGKNATLHFTPLHSINTPYTVRWQITNTGDEAREIGCLRGDEFHFADIIQANGIYIGRKETTAYRGTHYVQCFIVRNGNQCLGYSEPFVVRVV
jgi:class 3 adenylate cyclase